MSGEGFFMTPTLAMQTYKSAVEEDFLIWIKVFRFTLLAYQSNYLNEYSAFRANPAKTGGLIFVTLILFSKLHFLYLT